MKVQDIINSIQELPEQTRKTAAGFSIVVAGIITIFVLHTNINSQLASTADTQATPNQIETTAPEDTAPTPVEGIAESLGSIQKLLPESNTESSNQGPSGETHGTLGTEFAAIKRGFSILWHYYDTP